MTWRHAPRAFLQWLPALLLAFLPFSIAAVEIAVPLLVTAWIGELLISRTSVWQDALRMTAAATAAFFLVCAASILVSVQPEPSLKALIGKWLEYLLLFLVMTEVTFRLRELRWLGAVIAGAAAMVALEALWQERTGHGLLRGFELNIYGRMTGPYRSPSDLATYLMVAIPIVCGMLPRCRPLARGVLGALVVALLACFFRTLATGAWIALAAASGLILCRDRRYRGWALGGFAVLAAGGAVALAWTGQLSKAFSPADLGTQDRVYMWRAALGMIRDRPWLGHGLNTFMAQYVAYWVGGEQVPRYAHNCYLQMAAETGVIGLVAFLTLLGSGCLVLLRAVRDRVAERPVLAGTIVGVVAFLLQSGVDTNFYSVRQAALFWSTFGLALGAATRRGEPAGASRQEQER